MLFKLLFEHYNISSSLSLNKIYIKFVKKEISN